MAKEIRVGQRRISVLQQAFLLIGAITVQITVVAIVKPEAAAAFTAFSAALGAVGLALSIYFGADGYAKAKASAGATSIPTPPQV